MLGGLYNLLYDIFIRIVVFCLLWDWCKLLAVDCNCCIVDILTVVGFGVLDGSTPCLQDLPASGYPSFNPGPPQIVPIDQGRQLVAFRVLKLTYVEKLCLYNLV